MTDGDTKREKLIQEIFQTEESYIDNLKLVYEVRRGQGWVDIREVIEALSDTAFFGTQSNDLVNSSVPQLL